MLYIRALTPLVVPLLLVLSAGKFALVVMFFMHLRFDSKILTGLFVTGLLLATLMVTALVVVVLIEPVVAIIYGPEYLAVAPIVRWLMVLFLLRACRDPFALFLTNAFSRVGVSFSVAGILALATLVSMVVLVPAYGIAGAVTATIVSQAIGWVAFFWLAPEFLPMIPRASVRATAAAVGVAGAAYLAAGLVVDEPLLRGAALVAR